MILTEDIEPIEQVLTSEQIEMLNKLLSTSHNTNQDLSAGEESDEGE